ncbi:carboxypeptidase-like regulatory domain-containing protein [Flavobacterium sp. SLB02]|uniref:Kelch repeat-containing protein n=1 Tax=Flavobacterium sp. SLB02 TaxID=2665645 RepID=UPI0012A9E9C6|nr:carboxypeptidase-like regulatory domain-containing protein [Flavobacterium sp. SLB02]QGK75312.1 galactose oxidase [Flavobacterium sp. SLB02]
MKKLLLIFILFPLLSFAQTIKGTIVSTNNNLPLENTNILALSSKVGTISDENGAFSLKLLTKYNSDEILEFSHIGYTTTRISLSYLAKQNFIVTLEENIENLSGVTIAADQKLQSKLSFTQLTSLKHRIFSFGSLVQDGKIYVSGGDAYPEINHMEKARSEKADMDLVKFLNEEQYTSTKRHYKQDLCIYDIKTDTWEIAKLKLQNRAYHNIHFYNNLIYVIGGKKMFVNKISSWEYLQDQIEVVDLEKQTVKTDHTNPHQAADFASFTYKDNIIVMGGSVKSTESGLKDFTDKVHLYNISSGYWYELTHMPIAKETSGVLVEDKIYLVGGNNGKPISQIESFDLATEKWQTEGELFSALERPAITYHDNIIYFFEDQKMCVYDLKTKLLKEYEIGLPLKYSAMHYYNNKLYILAGRIDNSFSKLPASKVYSIDVNEFEITKPTRSKTLPQEVRSVKDNG